MSRRVKSIQRKYRRRALRQTRRQVESVKSGGVGVVGNSGPDLR